MRGGISEFENGIRTSAIKNSQSVLDVHIRILTKLHGKQDGDGLQIR